uniref:Ig-like domain-containing protein n=1 Tax=Glossina palpalis gambiensis TaxID=67801 RepID=A0A1B0B5Q7_9MUSC
MFLRIKFWVHLAEKIKGGLRHKRPLACFWRIYFIKAFMILFHPFRVQVSDSFQKTFYRALYCASPFPDLTQAALRNVNLYVEPPAVRRGQSVTLRCQYTLEGAPLYSVKFYRGQLEFFRYTPGEYPNTKVFHYPGIKVDESVSNATQVIIRNVSFNLSGNFACEVTADAPLFSTATAYAQMQVVDDVDEDDDVKK